MTATSPTLPIGSADRPLRVAIIGAGPSGFYAAESLFKRNELTVQIDLFDRLPTPFGLVRGGVAPDHQKIKRVVRVYEKTAAKEGFRFFGNVAIGRDLSADDLRMHYDQVIWAYGCESDRALGVPGEDLKGSYSATEFVGWYNGHPDYRDRGFQLDCETAVVVGIGNVAIDVARILLRDPDELAESDIADHALAVLRTSKVREVVLLGRRGAAQAAFSPTEIKELAELAGVDVVVRAEDADLDPISVAWLAGVDDKNTHENVAVLQRLADAGEGDAPRKVRLRLLASPVEVIGADGAVVGVRIERNELVLDSRNTPRPRGTGRTGDVTCGLVFRSVGYRGVALPGVPFDEGWGSVPNDGGRVLTARDGERVADEYVVGWIKRGPSGLIGTNRGCSVETVDRMVEDIEGRSAAVDPDKDGAAIVAKLRSRGVRWVDFAGWQRIDETERQRGEALGKVRSKLTTIEEMITVADEA